MVVPDHPAEQWFGIVMREAVSVKQLAFRGELDVFRQPSRQYRASVGPVPWGVFAVEFDFTKYAARYA